ncbi:MAG TPA: SGNH/GDSL hydrolase family protein [Chitinophagaceae bacterium]|nr:SGNH/GDSL hydrolase family protein [Chitinophagaceae bacterium]
MKLILVILFFINGVFPCHKNETAMSAPGQTAKKYFYLALGDSYTVGEMLPSQDNFPNQVYAMMKNDSADFQSPRIVAKTGWTTDELEAGIIAANHADPLRSSYDLVSLLIGVNDQYRGRSVDNYKPGFEELLKKAIAYAGNKAERVVVLSIPDWGVTPFATGRDREEIAREIDVYNAANKKIAEQYHVHYIDITPWTREAAADNSLLAADGLHPSGKEYKRWAEKITILFKEQIK